MAAMYLMWRWVKIKIFEELDLQECPRYFIYISRKVILPDVGRPAVDLGGAGRDTVDSVRWARELVEPDGV